MKYRVQVTETINHEYIIEANSREDARAIYQSYDRVQLSDLDLDGQSVWDSHPWEIEEDNETPAPLQIASASSAVANPELSAALAHARALAENPCNGGDPLGFGIYCSDASGEWIETGFSDEEAADRFAAAWTSYKEGNAARVGLVIGNSRAEWKGENLPHSERPYLGCGNECGHSQVFSGWVDEEDVAHFPCPNCGTIFEHSDWSSFFDEDGDNTPTPPANAIGARCLIRWERHRSASDPSLTVEWDELDRYISFSKYNEKTETDEFGIMDEKIFYYATADEFQTLCIDGEYHSDGWELVSFEWVTQ